VSASGVEIAKPFVEATVNVLSTMAMIQPKPGRPYVKKDKEAAGDVSAVIGFTGDKKGSISVTFTKESALSVVTNMLGEVEDPVQDIKDAVGEITNMISGQARAGLQQMGLNFHGSTPTVIFGDGHTIQHVSKGPVMAIPFVTEAGEFTVEFSFE
jgi:chemotaxis protein CheX